MTEEKVEVVDQTVAHHWAHCAQVFCMSGLVSRFITVLIMKALIGSTTGTVIGFVGLLITLGYWLLWILQELNEIIPRENHRRLFLRRNLDWWVIFQRTNLFELTYRLFVALSIIVGFIIGGYF